MFSHLPRPLIERAERIRLLIMDVDGVLTDAKLLFDADGRMSKAFNTLDGHGIKMLQESGVQTAIITARSDAAVDARAAQLGIGFYRKGSSDKKSVYQALLAETGLSEAQCAYIGDDVIDLPVMIRCGLPVAVPNAHAEVRKRAAYTTAAAGGNGAVRELCDLIMYAQGSFQAALDRYLQ